MRMGVKAYITYVYAYIYMYVYVCVHPYIKYVQENDHRIY